MTGVGRMQSDGFGVNNGEKQTFIDWGRRLGNTLVIGRGPL